jgi:hypothetical protein
MRIAALVLTAAVLAATPVWAQTDPTLPAPAPPASTEAATTATEPTASEQAEQPAQEEEQICRTVQRTESRLRNRRERICGTRSQWEMMQEQTARDVNRVGSVFNAPRN